MLQIDSEEMKNNDNTVVETIDLLDIDSENVIDDPIQLSVNGKVLNKNGITSIIQILFEF